MAGSIVVSTSRVGGLTKYSIAWTANASGVVSVNTFDIVPGYLVQIGYVPGTGSNKPGNLYDVKLLNSDGIDLLGDVGSNLSNAASTFAVLTESIWTDGGTVTPTVAAAGPLRTGTLNIWIGPNPLPAVQPSQEPSQAVNTITLTSVSGDPVQMQVVAISDEYGNVISGFATYNAQMEIVAELRAIRALLSVSSSLFHPHLPQSQ